VTDLLDLRPPAELLDDIVRGDAGLLVDEENAVDAWLSRLIQTISFRIEMSFFFASASGNGIVQPDAAL
jgi:hypothetical protein